MKPISLQLHNFMSHDQTKIDFSDVSLGVIVGPNGAGKSSIFQGITYALWGQIRTRSANDVVRRGTGGCAVSLIFDVNGNRYSAVRRRRVTSGGATDLELASISKDRVVAPLTGPTISETQKLINEIVGFSYEVFVNSALLEQGDAGRFSNTTPAKRKELLAEMLGLGRLQQIEQLARQERKSLEAERSVSNILLEQSVNELQVSLGVKPSSRANKAKLEMVRSQLGEANENLDMLAELLVEASTIRASVTLEDNQIAKENTELLSMADGISGIEEKIQIAKDTISNKDDVLLRDAEREKLKTVLADFNDLRDRVLQARILQAEIDAEEKQYSDKAERLPELLSRGEELHATHVDTLLEIDSVSKVRGKLTDKRLSLWNDLTELKTKEVNNEELILQTNVAIALLKLRISSLDLDVAECPTCERPISESEVLSLRTVASSDIELLKISLGEYHQIACDLMAGIVKLEDGVNKVTHELNQQEVHLATLKTTNDMVKKSQQLLDSGIAVAEDAKTVLDSGSLAQDKRKELLALGDTAKYSSDEHETVVSNLVFYDNVPEELKRIEIAENDLATLQGTAKNMGEIVNRLTDSLKLHKDKLLNLHEQLRKIPFRGSEVAIRHEQEKSRDAAQDLTSQIDKIKTEIIKEEQRQDTIKKTREQILELESKIGQVKGEIATCSLLVAASSKTGAQAMIIESALPHLEEATNRTLKHLTSNIEIRLESQKTTLSGNVRETLDILVYSGGHAAPIESLSGGERFRADLALRLAIGELLSDSGSKAQVLCIDEGFGSQDVDGQDHIVNIIRSLTNLFSLILVVTHVESVASSIAAGWTMFKVNRAGNVSTVREEK